MYRKTCIAVFSCLFAVVANIHCQQGSFSRNGNLYEVSYDSELRSASDTPPGYVEAIETVINEYESGKVAVENLNKFQNGLYQYFLLSLLEKTYVETIARLPVNSIPDPIALPDFVDDEISIRDVVVYGFPAFKRGDKPEPSQETLGSDGEFKATIRYNSDAMLFTGSFYINNEKYFFVYNLKKNAFTVKSHISRTSDNPLSVKRSVEFRCEDLTHTYDSSYENYPKVDELVTKTIITKFIPKSLDFLSEKVGDYIKKEILKIDLKYISSRKNHIIAYILKALKLFATAKNLDSFEVSGFNFTNTVGSRVYVQSYSDIKVGGILNYDKAEVVDSSVVVSDNGEYANISTSVQFTYPQDSSKETFVSFKLSSNSRESTTKMKVHSVTITAVYSSNLKERPLKVYRNKDAFYNGSGFRAVFDVDTYNLVFESLLRHVGHTVVKGIQDIVEGNVA